MSNPNDTMTPERDEQPADSALSASPCSVTAEDLAKAILDCAEEELQARLSGMDNGFDHPNAQILFGRAKALAQKFNSQNTEDRRASQTND